MLVLSFEISCINSCAKRQNKNFCFERQKIEREHSEVVSNLDKVYFLYKVHQIIYLYGK